MSSNLPPCLELSEHDLRLMLACDVHIGSQNLQAPMAEYVFKRRPTDGVHIIDLRKTWEKIVLSARVLATYENTSDICFVSTSKSSGNSSISQRAVMKAAHYLNAHSIAGKFTPGSFTNYIQKDYYEPSILVVADPRLDHQPITESSYVNLPVIALADTDSSLRLVDIAIPCNNRGRFSVPLVFWLLTREVLRIKGKIRREEPWDVMVDMFIQTRPEKPKSPIAQSEQNGAKSSSGSTTASSKIASTTEQTQNQAPSSVQQHSEDDKLEVDDLDD